MSEDVKLLPCPFCNGTNLRCFPEDGWWSVCCDDCDCIGSQCATEWIAKDRWNMREHHKSEILRWIRRCAVQASSHLTSRFNVMWGETTYSVDACALIAQIEKEMETELEKRIDNKSI